MTKIIAESTHQMTKIIAESNKKTHFYHHSISGELFTDNWGL